MKIMSLEEFREKNGVNWSSHEGEWASRSLDGSKNGETIGGERLLRLTSGTIDFSGFFGIKEIWENLESDRWDHGP